MSASRGKGLRRTEAEIAQEKAAALRRRVSDRVRAAIGLDVDVPLVPPQTIPRSEGTAVRVRLID
jgi:hypothetical protein